MTSSDFKKSILKLTKKSAYVQEKVRDKSLLGINQFLQKHENILQLEMIHCRMLWRGLLHGFWLCDGFEKQQKLATELSQLFWHIVVPSPTQDDDQQPEDTDQGLGSDNDRRIRAEKFILWMNAFYAELTRQWKYLDKWRLSKFMSLVRFTLHENMKFLYLSYDLTFDYNHVKHSDAIKTTIHSSNLVEPLPQDDNVEELKKLIQSRNTHHSDQSAHELNIDQTQCSIIDFYNLMMRQNLLVTDGLHTPDIVLFQVENLVLEYVRMISELVRETNPDAQVDGLDEEQTIAFINILKPYMNSYLKSLGEAYQRKFQKSILDPLLKDNDLLLIQQIGKLLHMSEVNNRSDVDQWRTKYKLRETDLSAAQNPDPLLSLQQEMDEISQKKEQRASQKKKKKKKKAKKRKQLAHDEEQDHTKVTVEPSQQTDADAAPTKQEPLVVTLDKENRVHLTSTAKKEKVIREKKQVYFSLDSNETRIYKVNSRVGKKNAPINTSAIPEKGILKAPQNSGKKATDLESVPSVKNIQKKRKRAKAQLKKAKRQKTK